MESALLADSRYGRATAIAGELYSSGRRSAGVSSGSLTPSPLESHTRFDIAGLLRPYM